MGGGSFGVDVDGQVAARDAAQRNALAEQELIAADWIARGQGKVPRRRQTPAEATRLARAFGSGVNGEEIPALLPVLVDIFLSAGPHSVGPPYQSCNNTDVSQCSLWRVRMYLGSSSPVKVQRIADGGPDALCPAGGGMGHIEPAVSPDGTQLAWTANCIGAGGKASSGLLMTQTLGERTSSVAYLGNAGTDAPVPQFPTWTSEEQLYFNVADESGHTAMMVAGTPPGGTAYAMFGPKNPMNRTTTNFQDLDAMRAPGYPGSTGLTMLVGFGGAVGADPEELVPRMVDPLAFTEDVFVLPEDWKVKKGTVPQCHHPAWNPGGTKVLCTRYQDPDTLKAGEIEYDLRKVYSFTRDSGTWENPEELVETLTPDQFNAISRFGGASLDLFTPRLEAHGAGCQAYVWKFAQWCGDSRYLVATVACNDNLSTASPKEMRNSRVFLIDITHGAPSPRDYVDLVTFIERSLGPGYVGTYNGIFSACRVVPAEEEL